MSKYVPLTVIERFPDYLNYLRALNCDKNEKISSGAIAAALGLGEVLVRKDLACTDCVGKPRVGYDVADLIAALEGALKCNVSKNAVIVGAGGLGRALMSYDGFHKYGINIAAAFDSDSGKLSSVNGKPVFSAELLEEKIAAFEAKLAVICVPAASAQSVCDRLVKAGITGILNFAPVTLRVGSNVMVRQVDLAAHLAILSCDLDF